MVSMGFSPLLTKRKGKKAYFMCYKIIIKNHVAISLSVVCMIHKFLILVLLWLVVGWEEDGFCS